MDDVEQVDGVELLGGAELRQTLDGGAVVGKGRDDREGRPAAALPLSCGGTQTRYFELTIRQKGANDNGEE